MAQLVSWSMECHPMFVFAIQRVGVSVTLLVISFLFNVHLDDVEYV